MLRNLLLSWHEAKNAYGLCEKCTYRTKTFLQADTVHDVYVGDSLESQKAKFDECLTKF